MSAVIQIKAHTFDIAYGFGANREVTGANGIDIDNRAIIELLNILISVSIDQHQLFDGSGATAITHVVAPITAVPTDAVPTDTIPTDAVPTDTIPTDTIPTDAVPTDTPPSHRFVASPEHLAGLQAGIGILGC